MKGLHPVLLPATLALLAAGMLINGGYDVDNWALPRAVIFSAVVISLVVSLTKAEPPEADE